MKWQKQLTPTEEFQKWGIYITNDAEHFADLVMDLWSKDISFKPDDAGSYRYCIVKA